MPNPAEAPEVPLSDADKMLLAARINARAAMMNAVVMEAMRELEAFGEWRTDHAATRDALWAEIQALENRALLGEGE